MKYEGIIQIKSYGYKPEFESGSPEGTPSLSMGRRTALFNNFKPRSDF